MHVAAVAAAAATTDAVLVADFTVCHDPHPPACSQNVGSIRNCVENKFSLIYSSLNQTEI